MTEGDKPLTPGANIKRPSIPIEMMCEFYLKCGISNKMDSDFEILIILLDRKFLKNCQINTSEFDLDLYSERMPRERITGSKSDLDLSAGSINMRVYMVLLLLLLLL